MIYKYMAEKMKNIEKNFLADIRAQGIELSPNAICDISKDRITISVVDENMNMFFASDITIYLKDKNRIQIPSTCSFNPDNYALYWKIIHAASILKNWEIFCKIANSYCNTLIKKTKKI